MKRVALVIDHESCWGCKTCEVACKQENRTRDGIKLISVSEDGPKMVNGGLDFIFQVNVCRHCDEPDCVEACPEEAILKREDGMVVMDYDLCTGCQACVEVCPYGSISGNDDEGIVQKCNLCHHRVEKGLIPACADNVCLAHCIYFGDPEEIHELMLQKKKNLVL